MPKKEKKIKKPKNDAATNGAFNEGQRKSGGVLFGAISLLSALLVIGAVLAGFLFFIVKMNLLGVADTYRESLAKVPLLNLALSKEEETEPSEMTFDDLLARYNTAVGDKDALAGELRAANNKIEDLSRAKSEYDAQTMIHNEKTAQLEKQVDDFEANKKKLEDMKYDLERIVANGDKEGFTKYFEGVSPEVAQEIYAQVMQEKKAGGESEEFIKTFQALDTKTAAKILETLGAQRIDFITQTLKSVKRSIAAEIIEKLPPELAAQVTLRLAGN